MQTLRLSEWKTYKSWQHMVQRCTNPKNERYHRYGGRGITVCDSWRGADGFKNFFEDMGRRPEGKTLDRENNDGNYCAENCRWADTKTQNDNKSPYFQAASSRGYYYDDIYKRFRSQIKVNGKIVYLGSYDTAEDAHAAYLKARELRGPYPRKFTPDLKGFRL